VSACFTPKGRIKSKITLKIHDFPKYTNLMNATAGGVMIYIFDITNRGSFDFVKNFYNQQEKSNKRLFIFLGNKLDRKKERQVAIEDIRDFFVTSGSRDHKHFYEEVSAKSGKNISTIFHAVAEYLFFEDSLI